MGVNRIIFVFPRNHYLFYCYNQLTCLWLAVKEEIDGKNDRVIDDALEKLAHMMDQANEALPVNQIHNGGVREFHGLGKFHKNKPLMFKGR